MKKLLLLTISSFIIVPSVMLANEDGSHGHTDSMDSMDIGTMDNNSMNMTDTSNMKKEETTVVNTQQTSISNTDTTVKTPTKKTTSTKKKTSIKKGSTSINKEEPKEISQNLSGFNNSGTVLSGENLSGDKQDEMGGTMSGAMGKIDSDKSHTEDNSHIKEVNHTSSTTMDDMDSGNGNSHTIISILFWIVFVGGGGLIGLIAYKGD